MKYIIFIFIIIVSITFYTKSRDTIYNEGVWNSISYMIVNGGKEKMTSDIKITHSEAILLEDRIRLLVYFKIENTADYPNSFGWDNKYIISQDEISFAPLRGIDVENLQPYIKSNELYTEYKLPKYVNIDRIYWGLYDTYSHSMRYKILLKPNKVNKSIENEQIEVTLNKLLIETKDLIGREVKILCKGNQFMQINQKQKTFNASCKDIDNPYTIVNYEVAFKYKDSLLPIIYQIKNESKKFYVTGKVEWPDSNNFMSKIIIDVGNIEISH